MYVIYDFETLKNCFLACFKIRGTDEWHDFVIWKERNDLRAFLAFLDTVLGEIGYNCVNFDSQVQQWIIVNKEKLLKMTSDQVTEEIHKYASKVIQLSNDKKFLDYPEWKLSIPQCDPFLINHYNNQAKSTSLKWLQFSMNWEDIVEMNVDHNIGIETKEELSQLIYYCHNDVLSTEKFYEITKGNTDHSEYKGKDQIQLRKDIGKLINKSCINWNDVKIGEQLNLINYIKATNLTKEQLYEAKKEAYKSSVYLGNCVPAYIQFKSEHLKILLGRIKSTVINVRNANFEESITIGKTQYKMALGGLHSNESPRKVILKDDQILRDADVGGQYPCSIIRRKLFPSHLSDVWCKQIQYNVDERNILKPKAKKGDKQAASWSEAYKLANNGGGYGKLGEITNWQNDFGIMYSVTIGCQLEILMLIEELELNGINVISANTDGFVSLFKKEKESVYVDICKKWEEITGSTVYGQLEFADYKTIIQTSVNDYLAIKTDGSLKFKGDFVYDPLLHKNKSRRIVPLALKAYYVDNIKPEDFILNHKDIFDFCCAVRADSSMSLWTIDNGKYTKQQKTVRYYISNSKESLLKRMKALDNKRPTLQYDIFGGLDTGIRENQVEAGYKITIFNKYIKHDNFLDYNINYNYYIKKVNDIIKKIDIFTIENQLI